MEQFQGGDPVPPDSVTELRRELVCLKAARRAAIDRFEVEYVRALLEKAGGNVTRAATFAEISRQVIHKLIAKHRLTEPPSRAGAERAGEASSAG